MKDIIKDEDKLLEYIHKRIAVPDVAGYPTGGAVDLEIYDSAQDKMLDFGSTILDFDDIKCNYYSDDLTEEAKANRQLLRDVMLSQNFAPFNGEWWHYCYGDKEWAFYYKKDKALYSQMKTNEVLNNIERRKINQNYSRFYKETTADGVDSAKESGSSLNGIRTASDIMREYSKLSKADR